MSVAVPAVVTVLIADDHEATRDDVRAALERDARFRVAAAVGDAVRAVEAALYHRPRVCLLDISMPGDGIAAAWEITARLPDTKVVMLTVSTDEDHLFAALRAGASGYLLKDIDRRRLPLALLDVLDGEAAMPRQLVARLIQQFRDPAPRRRPMAIDGPGSRLTAREWEVLELLREELTTDEMAGRLYVSPATVRSHVAAIMRKLRVPDRDAVVRLLSE